MPEKEIQAVPQAPVQGDEVREQDKIMLVLAYLGILSLIPFLTVKDSDYVRFHARQGFAMFLCSLALIVIYVIPFIGWVIGCIGWLGWLTLAIVAIVKAFKPERWRIPLVASIADALGK